MRRDHALRPFRRARPKDGPEAAPVRGNESFAIGLGAEGERRRGTTMHVLQPFRQRGRRIRMLICAALFTTALLPGRSSGDERTVKPFQVIDHALTRWRGRPRPLQLSYVVNFIGHNKNGSFRRRFRVDNSLADHATHVTTLASEGPAPPFVQPEKQRFLPTETFGFIPPGAVAAGPTPAPAATSLPVIAAVHATVRYRYDVSFVGIENVDNGTAYHLQLDPRQARDAYPLREIWIDTSTYDVLQVVAQQFEHLGPIAIPYRISARYAEQGPYWLIAHAEAGATIHAGLFSYGSSANADFEDFQYAP
jgi:hypothetical protein